MSFTVMLKEPFVELNENSTVSPDLILTLALLFVFNKPSILVVNHGVDRPCVVNAPSQSMPHDVVSFPK